MSDSHEPTADASTRIVPRTLKGFRDYLPETMIPRERLMETARRVYRSYGFSPIDTPALGVSGNPLRQGGRRDRQAALQVLRPGQAVGGFAVRSYRAAGAFRRAARRRAGRALQTLPHRHRLAGREHAARPVPRVHAVRFRHDRHAPRGLGHRDRAGDPRPVAGHRLRANSRFTSTTARCLPACSSGWGWPSKPCRCSARWTSWPRSGRSAWRKR